MKKHIIFIILVLLLLIVSSVLLSERNMPTAGEQQRDETMANQEPVETPPRPLPPVTNTDTPTVDPAASEGDESTTSDDDTDDTTAPTDTTSTTTDQNPPAPDPNTQPPATTTDDSADNLLADGAACTEDNQCGSGFCQKSGANACSVSTAGTCQPKPEVCIEVYQPVCGCDNVTYSNTCYAAAAGANVATTTACTN